MVFFSICSNMCLNSEPIIRRKAKYWSIMQYHWLNQTFTVAKSGGRFEMALVVIQWFSDVTWEGFFFKRDFNPNNAITPKATTHTHCMPAMPSGQPSGMGLRPSINKRHTK